MADTLRDIGAKMANVMFNLAQRPGDALTGDVVSTMDSLRKQWDAAVRATPPSPSTAPEVDERSEFEAWSKRVAPAHEIERDSFDQYVSYPVHAGWAAWQARAALASRPAEVGDEGLPPLPKPHGQIDDYHDDGHVSFHDGYTAEQYRQGQRDAVAADRVRRGDGWISVEDSLPPKYEEVIVWPHPTDYCMTAELYGESASGRPVWKYGEYVTGHGHDLVEITWGPITHWRNKLSAPSHTTNKEK